MVHLNLSSTFIISSLLSGMHRASGVMLQTKNTGSSTSVYQLPNGVLVPIDHLGVDVAKVTLGIFVCPGGASDK